MASISLKYKSKQGSLTAPGDVDPGAMIPIATATVGSGGAANVEFTSIPDTYAHLQLRLFASATSNTSGAIQINGNTTVTNYWTHTLLGNGSSASATAYNNTYVPYYTSTGSNYSVSIIDILDYTSTSKLKTLRILGGYDANGSGYVFLQSLNFNSTSAITSIKLLIDGSTNWNNGTHAALYGIKRAGA